MKILSSFFIFFSIEIHFYIENKKVIRMFRCEICHRIFLTERALKIHHSRKHKGFPCNYLKIKKFYKIREKRLKQILSLIPKRDYITAKQIGEKVGLGKFQVFSYLKMLKVLGKVEERKFGRSKVYRRIG